jgi:hypothetical protein
MRALLPLNALALVLDNVCDQPIAPSNINSQPLGAGAWSSDRVATSLLFPKLARQ